MTMPAPEAGEAPVDPLAMLKTRSYIQLLVLAAVIGVPVSALAFGFLKLVSLLQGWLFESLPKAVGFAGTPVWWPLPLLALSGCWSALTITYLPGTGGHVPAEGFKAGGAPTPAELPGVALAALATLSLGAVLGPEAPLIAIGGGLGLLSVKLAKRGRATHRLHRHRRRRGLRRHQHPVRVTHPRRLPPDGGVRPGRADDGPGPRPRPAGRRASARSSSSGWAR